jgi:hypothetical protein
VTTFAVGVWVVTVSILVPPYFAAVIYLATKEYQPMSKYLRDLLERVVSTFAMAFLGAISVGGMSIGNAKTALLAAVAAVLSLAKGLIAKRIGSNDTASLTV